MKDQKSMQIRDTGTFQAVLVAVISKMIMDHELEKMRNAASHILRYNTNIVRPMKEPGTHSGEVG
jgi:hypothetical protein